MGWGACGVGCWSELSEGGQQFLSTAAREREQVSRGDEFVWGLMGSSPVEDPVEMATGQLDVAPRARSNLEGSGLETLTGSHQVQLRAEAIEQGVRRAWSHLGLGKTEKDRCSRR